MKESDAKPGQIIKHYNLLCLLVDKKVNKEYHFIEWINYDMNKKKMKTNSFIWSLWEIVYEI